MTAFNASTDLPTGNRAITTLEELLVWTSQALALCNPTDRFVRTVGDASELTCQYGRYPDSQGIYRHQGVAVILVDPAKVGTSAPDWKTTKEVSTTPIPANMKG